MTDIVSTQDSKAEKNFYSAHSLSSSDVLFFDIEH